MAERPDFQEQQIAFAAHIRDPANAPAPQGIEERRLAIYRDLFFNNMNSLLSSTFPVLRKLHEPDDWRSLVREFMVRHRAHTPYFSEIPREFLEFLETGHEPSSRDFPFLLELAHYEWMELALSVATTTDDLSTIDADGNLLDGVPVKSVLAWSLTYRFPVHRISRDFLPSEPGDGPTCLVIYRKPDLDPGFMELNPLTSRLLERIADNEKDSGRQILEGLAEEIGFDSDSLTEHGQTALEELRNAGILPGTRRT